MAQLNIRIPRDLRKAAVIRAKQEDVTLQALITVFLEEWLREGNIVDIARALQGGK